MTPQTTMGIAADHRYAYVGGNNVIARHDLRTGEVRNLRAPGEAKDAEVLNGVLYTGQYNSQGIWRYAPGPGGGPRRAAGFPGEQNRPLDICWDDVNRLLLVAVQSDTEGGGALWTYSPGKAEGPRTSTRSTPTRPSGRSPPATASRTSAATTRPRGARAAPSSPSTPSAGASGGASTSRSPWVWPRWPCGAAICTASRGGAASS
ncbi:hypothetical protein ACFQ60_05770 [Streptomyces zhihengii]